MWIARNKDGSLYLFKIKPIRVQLTIDGIVKEFWDEEEIFDGYDKYIHKNEYFEIDSHLFPNLKWEDEPQEILLITQDSMEKLMSDHATEVDRLNKILEKKVKHTPEEIYALAEKAYKDGGYDIPEQTMFGTVNVDFTNFRWGFEEGYYCK